MDVLRIAIPAAAALLVLGQPPGARALHVPPSGPDARSCYACHSLDADAAASGTSLINLSSRTFPLMKFYNGNTVPEVFGCTYCHSSPANTRMRDALSHFRGKTSAHPVGRSFVTAADTNNEYVSGEGTDPRDELDCDDCHDVRGLGTDRDPDTPGIQGTYPEHGPPGDPANNPFMLRGVSAAGQYDDFCRACHGRSAPGSESYKGSGVDIRLGGSSVRHEDASEGHPIVEDDGTALKPTAAGGGNQCRACHDTHFSLVPGLLNDGHEGDTPITTENCTAICHFPGDAADYLGEGPGENTFTRGGHGKAASTYRYRGGQPDATGSPLAMGLGCTSGGCHVNIDLAVKPHIERLLSGTVQDRYRARFNLSPRLQAGDSGSLFGSPLWGICLLCHRGSENHRAEAGQTGCLDCHDEHAEGAGANLFMIPERSRPNGSYIPAKRPRDGAESVTYQTAHWDVETEPYESSDDLEFFRGDGAGVCDVEECHGAAGFAPLTDWLDEGGHGDDAFGPGDDCASCHRHNGNPGGGWRARER